jgi:hypothetical protein
VIKAQYLKKAGATCQTIKGRLNPVEKIGKMT